MRFPLATITAASLRHRKLVVFLWVLLAGAGALTATAAVRHMTYSYGTPGQPGYEANQHLMARFGIDPTIEPTIAVLHLPPGESMRTAAGRDIAARVFAAAPRAGIVAVADYATTHNPKLISADGQATWAVVNMPNPDTGPGVGVVGRLGPVLDAAAPRGVSVTLTGFAQLLAGQGGSGAGPSVLLETVIGGLLALVVLLLVYGSAIAIVPLMMAVPAILVTFLAVLGLTYATNISYFLQYLIALVGLGVAVDYSLLVVTRWREERHRGLSNEEAIVAAGGQAGRAVLLSGVIVAAGLLSLVILPVPFLRSIGFGGMLIPLVAVAAALTLLPVTLSAWGPALDRWRIGGTPGTRSRPWERWGRLIVRWPVAASAVGLVAILALALPAFSVNTAEPLVGSLPATGPAARAFQQLERSHMPAAADFPIQVLSHGGASGAARAAAATPGVYTVLAPATTAFRRGGEALLTVIPTAQGSTAAGRAIVIRLRARLANIPGGDEVGGSTAGDIAFSNAVYGHLPLILLVIGVVTFLILARAFRSIVLALKAVVLNVVSLGSAFGFMVFFWQEGHGSSLVYGVPATAAIRDWIPIVVFACLFGLSMDYEVFLLARIREEYDRSGSTQDAVVEGLARTGRLVTCAALILAVSFLSLSSNPNQLVKIVASALAFGVLVDAVIVRTLLVPALVTLMGRWNWWMPPIAARLLRIPPPAVPPGHEQHSTVSGVRNSQPSSPMEGEPSEEPHAEQRP